MTEATSTHRPATNPEDRIRPARPADRAEVISVAKAVGLFGPPELAELDGILAGYLDGSLGEGHAWIVDEDASGLTAIAYYAPERMTDGTWNLYLIAVRPDRQGLGRGAAILRHVEAALAAQGQRVLLIETSGQEEFAGQRAFYRGCGYEEEARIREFYAAGVDKIVFRKALPAAA